MLHFLPAPLLGLLSFALIFTNTVVIFSLFLPFIALKLLFPSAKRWGSQVLIWLAEQWVQCNSGLLWLTQKTKWDVTGLENLSRQKSYLVISNHRSWTDIFVLQHVLKDHVPFLKFFIKQILIWLPFLGAAWWALDMPFMKRYSRQYLEKHPEKRGQDMATTRRSCEKFKDYPVAIINFLEGTRYTPAKKQKQQSPYEHLLIPKAGGVAMVLSLMGDYLTEIVDVTIVYPKSEPFGRIWHLLSGQIPAIQVHIRTIPLPENTMGQDYLDDPTYRERIQEWVNRVWQSKDQQYTALRTME